MARKIIARYLARAALLALNKAQKLDSRLHVRFEDDTPERSIPGYL